MTLQVDRLCFIPSEALYSGSSTTTPFVTSGTCHPCYELQDRNTRLIVQFLPVQDAGVAEAEIQIDRRTVSHDLAGKHIAKRGLADGWRPNQTNLAVTGGMDDDQRAVRVEDALVVGIRRDTRVPGQTSQKGWAQVGYADEDRRAFPFAIMPDHNGGGSIWIGGQDFTGRRIRNGE